MAAKKKTTRKAKSQQEVLEQYRGVEGLLTRDQVLAADDIGEEIVDVPEWGGKLVVRALDAERRDYWETQTIIRSGDDVEVNTRNVRAKLVQASVIDPRDGKLLFSDTDIEDLGKKSAKAMQRVFDVASRLSRLRKDDIKELTQNLGTTPAEGSSSASPSH